MKTLVVSSEKYKCLREHLRQANEIFKSLGMDGRLASECDAPKPLPKETKPQKINKYKMMISNGQRGTKPNYLKK